MFIVYQYQCLRFMVYSVGNVSLVISTKVITQVSLYNNSKRTSFVYDHIEDDRGFIAPA